MYKLNCDFCFPSDFNLLHANRFDLLPHIKDHIKNKSYFKQIDSVYVDIIIINLKV